MDIIQALERSEFVFLVFVGVLGLIVGSFLNVVIHRLPKMLERQWHDECHDFLELENKKNSATFNLATPPSTCPQCKHQITALENIPVFSYLFLAGKCKKCKTAISIRYPLVELLTACLSLIVAHHFGFGLQAILALVVTWAFISLAFIDADTQLLPDIVTLPLLWVILFASIFNVFITPSEAITGAIFGYLVLWIVFWIFKFATGKEGIAYGDFKLLAVIGALLGIEMLPQVIMMSAFAGSIIGLALIAFQGRDKSTPIPFGPYLTIAGFIAMIWGEKINQSATIYLGL